MTIGWVRRVGSIVIVAAKRLLNNIDAAIGYIGAAYGLRLGTAGTLAGAAVGAYLGASVCRKLLARTGDIEGELELDMNVEDEAA